MGHGSFPGSALQRVCKFASPGEPEERDCLFLHKDGPQRSVTERNEYIKMPLKEWRYRKIAQRTVTERYGPRPVIRRSPDPAAYLLARRNLAAWRAAPRLGLIARWESANFRTCHPVNIVGPTYMKRPALAGATSHVFLNPLVDLLQGGSPFFR